MYALYKRHIITLPYRIVNSNKQCHDDAVTEHHDHGHWLLQETHSIVFLCHMNTGKNHSRIAAKLQIHQYYIKRLLFPVQCSHLRPSTFQSNPSSLHMFRPRSFLCCFLHTITFFLSFYLLFFLFIFSCFSIFYFNYPSVLIFLFILQVSFHLFLYCQSIF